MNAGSGRAGFAGRCAARLGLATAAAFPLLVWLTGVSVNADLSVFGFDAMGAGIELRGSGPMALLLGALWGAVAGGLGAVPALLAGAAGRRAATAGPPPAPPTGCGPSGDRERPRHKAHEHDRRRPA